MNAVKNDTHRSFVEDKLVSSETTNVQPIDIQRALKRINKGKACGLDGIAAEHFIFAHPIIHVLLSMLFNCMLIHGHLPKSFMLSAIVPIVKNKTGDTMSKNNYRPVAIVSPCSKILEAFILNRIDGMLFSSDHQFGFKSHHSTDLCIFALKSVTNYYLDLHSPVSSCFLDASKAFDRVNHWTLFKKMINCNVPLPIVNILCKWYRSQDVLIRWGSTLSNVFNVSNGVRQGSLLSPKLFTLYMNDLSVELNNSSTGCFLNNVCTNHLFYADDICLLAPSSSALQKLLNICFSYGIEHDIVFNSSKSFHLVFKPRNCTYILPRVYLNSVMLPLVNETKYLGVMLDNNLCDDVEIKNQYCRLYARSNTILRKFKHCTLEVKKQLFLSYCTNFYCSALWSNFKQVPFKKARVAYNNVFRSLFKYNRRSSASAMFVNHNVFNFDALLRKCSYDFRSRLFKSHNSVLIAIRSSFYVRNNAIFNRWNDILYTF